MNDDYTFPKGRQHHKKQNKKKPKQNKNRERKDKAVTIREYEM